MKSRIRELKDKLRVREGTPGMMSNVRAIRAELARLENGRGEE